MAVWFRFHAEVLNDPKAQRLDGETFKAWVNILCLACAGEGKLPPIEDIAFALRMDVNAARTVVERLVNGGLIDKVSGGPNGYAYAPHAWNERQYKSDTSTDRVKRFRKRFSAVTETAPDTDTDTDITLDKSNVTPINSDKVFWDAAKAYLGGGSSALIGKWARDFGKPETARAITAAQLERPADPKSYIAGILRKGAKAAEPAFGGPC